MRLLFLSNFYPPHALGGYEQWCQEVAEALGARGHTVTVLTSRYGLQPGETATLPERNQPVIRGLHLETDLYYYRPLDFFFQRRRQEQENRHLLARVLQEQQPDAVLVWGMWNLSLNLPYWLEEWLPARVAYFISSYWPLDCDPHTAYWQLPTRHKVAAWAKWPLRRLALAQLRREGYPPPLRFAHAVCCSHYVRKTLVEAQKLPPEAGVLLGGTDAIPLQQPQAAAGGPAPQITSGGLRLLYFGRLIHDKGVHTAIEAVAQLQQAGQGAGITLTILGSGHHAYEAQLHERVKALGLTEQVTFVSQVPRAEVPQWLAQHDVYLFTSIWPEPMARSVMEAMAAGLLVIGTEVGGQTEMLTHGVNALTFPAGDANALATQIATALQQPTHRAQLAAAGQQLVLERFTLQRMVDDLEMYLAQLVAATVHDTQPKSQPCTQFGRQVEKLGGN